MDSRNSDYTVIDLEMTGLDFKKDKVIEIGAARVRDGQITHTYATFLQCKSKIPDSIVQLTGITQEMLSGGVPEDEGMRKLFEFMGDDVLLGQNFRFDYSFLQQWAVNHKIKLENACLDTLKIAREILPKEQPKNLGALCDYFGIGRAHGHRALEDALETHEVYLALCKEAGEREVAALTPSQPQVKVKRVSPLTKSQKEQIENYRARHNVTEPIDWDSLNRSEASRLMERYYRIYGR